MLVVCVSSYRQRLSVRALPCASGYWAHSPLGRFGILSHPPPPTLFNPQPSSFYVPSLLPSPALAPGSSSRVSFLGLAILHAVTTSDSVVRCLPKDYVARRCIFSCLCRTQ